VIVGADVEVEGGKKKGFGLSLGFGLPKFGKSGKAAKSNGSVGEDIVVETDVTLPGIGKAGAESGKMGFEEMVEQLRIPAPFNLREPNTETFIPRDAAIIVPYDLDQLKNCNNCGMAFTFLRDPEHCHRCGLPFCRVCCSIKYEAGKKRGITYCPTCKDTDEKGKCPVCLRDWKDLDSIQDKGDIKSIVTHLEASIKHLDLLEASLRVAIGPKLSSYLYEHHHTHLENEKEVEESLNLSPRSLDALNPFADVVVHEDTAVEYDKQKVGIEGNVSAGLTGKLKNEKPFGASFNVEINTN